MLSAGDEAPIEDPAVIDQDEDIEDNLLRPPGMTPEPSDLLVKVFVGEDLPQSDPSYKTGINAIDRITRQQDKENCDPYFKVWVQIDSSIYFCIFLFVHILLFCCFD